MNKYVKLISNTLLFAVGTFSSKVLALILVPLYAHVLTTGEVGLADLLVQTSNLILPLATVGILNAIIRFGLDKGVRKGDVFTIGLIVISCGFCVFLLAEPLLASLVEVSGYTIFVYLYVLTSSLRSLCSQFVRAKELVRLYALDGVLATATVVLFTVLFLPVLRWGVAGYMLATILSDLCSVVFLFLTARLWNYIRLRKGMGWVFREMLRYSLPLIPTTVSWWVMNMSSRYIIMYKLGLEYNGLLSVAYRVPTVVSLVSSIFIDAWQMSAITDVQTEQERAEFFTKVFSTFQAVVFLSASGLILMDKVIMKVLVLGSEKFYPAWQYIPILVMATSFSCMVTFLGSVYMVEKRSVLSLATTLVGAVLNVALCFVLVPVYQVNGAALAMLASYIVVFVLRVISAQRMVRMQWSIPKLILNVVLVSAQSYIMIKELPLWIVWEVLLTCVSAAINLKPILVQLARFLQARKSR